jgi:hypothetical protein
LGIGGELYATEQDDDAGIISGPPPANGNHRQDGPHSQPPSPLPPRERLTNAQLNAIKAIARKQNLDPANVRRQIKQTYGVEVEYLTKRQASEVITDLDGNKPTNGNGTSGNHAWAG